MPVITISRGSLSGGELLAEHLRSKLGFRVISREVIVEAANRYGVSEAKLAEEMRKPPGLLERLTHAKDRYVLAVQAALAEMVRTGDVIYHGLCGQLLLRGLSSLVTVRLIAPLEYRVRQAMIELDCTREKALQHIASVDEQRSRWVHHIYGVDWADPARYDIVLNLEHVDIDTAAEVVAALVRRRQERARPAEEQRELEDFALAARIRAELTFHADVPIGAVGVEVEGDTVRLTGEELLRSDGQRVARFVRGLPGVGRVLLPGEEAAAESEERPEEVTARSVMLPIDAYPHLHTWNTIGEAIVAIGASSVQLRDGHLIPPRYVLVVDEDDRLIGVVARRDLLRGLLPQLENLEKAREHAFLSLADDEYPIPIQWISLLSSASVQHAAKEIASVMRPIKATIAGDDDLNRIVTTMLQHDVDLVPVMEGHNVVGVVLMTDVFDSVGQYIVEHGGAGRPQK